jgi:hypothetical protein
LAAGVLFERPLCDSLCCISFERSGIPHFVTPFWALNADEFIQLKIKEENEYHGRLREAFTEDVIFELRYIYCKYQGWCYFADGICYFADVMKSTK